MKKGFQKRLQKRKFKVRNLRAENLKIETND